MKKQLLVAEKDSGTVTPLLTFEAAKRFDGLMGSLKKAAADEDCLVTANDSIELYRILIDSLDAAHLEVPKEIGLLDYVGFKVHVLGKMFWIFLDRL